MGQVGRDVLPRAASSPTSPRSKGRLPLQDHARQNRQAHPYRLLAHIIGKIFNFFQIYEYATYSEPPLIENALEFDLSKTVRFVDVGLPQILGKYMHEALMDILDNPVIVGFHP